MSLHRYSKGFQLLNGFADHGKIAVAAHNNRYFFHLHTPFKENRLQRSTHHSRPLYPMTRTGRSHERILILFAQNQPAETAAGNLHQNTPLRRYTSIVLQISSKYKVENRGLAKFVGLWWGILRGIRYFVYFAGYGRHRWGKRCFSAILVGTCCKIKQFSAFAAAGKGGTENFPQARLSVSVEPWKVKRRRSPFTCH